MQPAAIQQPLQQSQPQDILPENQPGADQDGGQSTIDADLIEEHVKQQMDEQQQKNLDRLLDEGNELLFGKETHYQLLKGLEKSQNIAKDLGEGAYSMMMALIKQGANIPGEIILPAGAILIARVASFMNESGMIAVTDDDYANAVETFGHLIMQHDPQFMARMKQNTGQMQPQEVEQDTGIASSGDGQNAGQMPAQGMGGLLDMTGRTGG